ncbi:MAG: hypothetical protein H7Y36_07165, partial [Armatimonadetes bacterium]|nr:hypothetical protein [Akkermansiaceae bacterium]
GWGNQSRETDGTAWSEACRFHAAPTLIGLAWIFIALQISESFALWMAPILSGLVLSIPVSVWTSRARFGRALASRKILATPEELDQPQIIHMANEAAGAKHTALNATTSGREGIVAAVVDPYVNGVHVSLLEHMEMNSAEEALANRCLKEGPGKISNVEMTQLLYLAPAMLMMHRSVWLGITEGIHEVWSQAVESYRKRPDMVSAAEGD